MSTTTLDGIIGIPVRHDPDRWRKLDALARVVLPKATTSFHEIHVSLAGAIAGNDAAVAERLLQMDEMEQAARYPAGGVPQAIARGLAEYARGDRAGAITVLAPLLPELERVGAASRAQLDMAFRQSTLSANMSMTAG